MAKTNFFDYLIDSATGVVQEVLNTMKYYSNLIEVRFNSWIDSFFTSKPAQEGAILDHSNKAATTDFKNHITDEVTISKEANDVNTMLDDVTEEGNDILHDYETTEKFSSIDVSHLLPKGTIELVESTSSDTLIALETKLINGTIDEMLDLSNAEMDDFEQFSKEYDEDIAQEGAATLKDARKDHEEDEGFVEEDFESAETSSSDALNSAGLVWDNYEVVTTTTLPYNLSQDTISILFRACMDHYQANYQQPSLVGRCVDSVIGDIHNPLIESEC